MGGILILWSLPAARPQPLDITSLLASVDGNTQDMNQKDVVSTLYRSATLPMVMLLDGLGKHGDLCLILHNSAGPECFAEP